MTIVFEIETEMTEQQENETWTMVAQYQTLTEDAICIDNQWRE